MVPVETTMLAVLIVACVIAAICDIKNSIVPNAVILFSIVVEIILSVFYYSLFVYDITLEYVFNVALAILISLLLYGLQIWGGGDSKMLLMIAIGYPARIYGYLGSEYFPLVNLYAIIFSVGFIFILLDSLILFVKRTPVTHKKERLDIWEFIREYFINVIYIVTLFRITSLFLSNFFVENPIITLFFNFFLAYCIHSFSLFKRIWMVVTATSLYVFFFFDQRSSFWSPQVYSYIISVLVIMLRQQIEKYNYLIVKPEQLRAGMVLSTGTVLQFSGSRIRGLPKDISESLRIRLSDTEINAVVRWSKKNQEKAIVIARKIPFAIFILLGVLIFMGWGIYSANTY